MVGALKLGHQWTQLALVAFELRHKQKKVY